MEVGAVKQAFNNEVIHLKKSLNQARIQIIHKLTRKAKTLTEKKAPEHLKEKNKKKAESAVNEVLIMKKLKARDIAQFIITHKLQLKQYLNKPQADREKACARLLSHKSLEHKYKLIKEKYGDVPIHDLLMSRQERRKLKKEQKEQQKNKKNGKVKVVNSEGDWDVEEVRDDKMGSDEIENGDQKDDGEQSNDQESDISGQDTDNGELTDDDGEQLVIDDNQSELESSDQESDNDIEMNELKSNVITGQFVKLNKKPDIKSNINKPDNNKSNINKKVKENKNKKLDAKILKRQFKKNNDDSELSQQKIVDPFFITETGENYLSLAEPRQPDEVKEIHKQGNRKLRRAIMFGHVPKIKPRHRQDGQQNQYNNHNDSKFNNHNSKNDSRFNNDNVSRYNNDRSNNSKFKNNNKVNDRSFNNKNNEKEEKLHPSWEAKKKQSGILPFQGKKIVFQDS